MHGFDRCLLPSGRAGCEHLDERESSTLDLVLYGAAHCFSRPHVMLGVGQSHPLDINGRVERSQQLRYAKGITFRERRAAQRRSDCAGSQRSRRRHLTARHSVDPVIDKEDRDVLTAVGCVQNLVAANRGEIAVALITKNDALRTGAFDPGGDCRGSSVGRLNMTDVQVIVGEDGATYRVDQDGTVLNAEIYNSFRYELVQNAVTASRTVVSGLEVSPFALKNVEKSRRFTMRSFP